MLTHLVIDSLGVEAQICSCCELHSHQSSDLDMQVVMVTQSPFLVEKCSAGACCVFVGMGWDHQSGNL